MITLWTIHFELAPYFASTLDTFLIYVTVSATLILSQQSDLIKQVLWLFIHISWSSLGCFTRVHRIGYEAPYIRSINMNKYHLTYLINDQIQYITYTVVIQNLSITLLSICIIKSLMFHQKRFLKHQSKSKSHAHTRDWYHY